MTHVNYDNDVTSRDLTLGHVSATCHHPVQPAKRLRQRPQLLGERAKREGLELTCVATSSQTERLARPAGLTLATRAEAFWRWPILLGANMPGSARGAGGRRTTGLSAATP